MALSLPTFPAWLWKNPNSDPAIDSSSNPTPTTPIPNPNPNSQYLTLSSQEPQHTILDGEAAHPHQWITPNPNPNPNPNPSSNPLYNHSHSHKAGEGIKKNLYGAWGHNYGEFQAYSLPQKEQVSYPQRRRKRRQAMYRPRRIPSFDLGLGIDLDFDLDRELDLVLVRSPPGSDHNWSSAESEGSDWSVGWFEPHAPEFCSSKRVDRSYGDDDGGDNGGDDVDESENSFAVLVPCYRPSRAPSDIPSHLDSESKSQLWAAVLSNIANDPHPGTNHYLQQWLSSLQA